LQQEIVQIQLAAYLHSGAAVDVAEKKSFELLICVPVSWKIQTT